MCRTETAISQPPVYQMVNNHITTGYILHNNICFVMANFYQEEVFHESWEYQKEN